MVKVSKWLFTRRKSRLPVKAGAAGQGPQVDFISMDAQAESIPC